MKYSALLPIIICFSLCSCKEQKKAANNDWSRMNLRGKVKTLTEADYYLDTTGVKQGKVLRWKETYQFNEQGMVTGKIQYDEKGEVNTKYTYLYDTAGRLITETVHADTLLYTTTHTYSKEGNKITTNIVPADAIDIAAAFEYRYNDKKQLIQVTVSNNDVDDPHAGKPDYTWQYEEQYEYNKEGQKTKRLYRDADSFKQATIYGYDEQEHCITEISDTALPHKVIKTIRKYDDKGNETEETSYEQDGSIHSHKVEEYKTYDATGNWLTQNIHWKDLGTTAIERTIEYYTQ